MTKSFLIDFFQNKIEKVSQYLLFEKKEEKSVKIDFFQFFFKKVNHYEIFVFRFKWTWGTHL